MASALPSSPVTDRAPLLFEALPTDARLASEAKQGHVDSLRPLAKLGVDAINVPEILDGAYPTVEPRRFARAVQETTGLPAIVNRITVQEPAAAFDAWIDDTVAVGIEHVVLVGGERSDRRHPGPSVTQGLRRAAPRVPGRLGVITIPTRRRPDLDEPERLAAKRRAGADLAISQILCEAEAAKTLHADVGPGGIPICWSLAPVVRTKDLAFLQWLGVEVPKAYERRLRGARDDDHRRALSQGANADIARSLLEHAEEEGLGPVGFCIEHVMRSNMEPAFALVERVQGVLKEFKGLRVAA